MKTLKICKTFIGVFILTFTLMVLFNNKSHMFAYEGPLLKGGTYSDYILYTESDVVTYLENKYKGKSDLKISYYSTRHLDTINLDQTTLNRYYQLKTGVDKTTGNCTPVAITILMEYYDRVKDDLKIEDDVRDAYITILDLGVDNGYTSHDDGTFGYKIDNYVEAVFSHYGSNNTANNDDLKFLDTIKSELIAQRPVIYSTETHSVVIRGYSQYKITYKKTEGILWWKKTVTKTEYFKAFRVSEGWYNDGYTFFPEDKLNASIFSSHKLTRVEEK